MTPRAALRVLDLKPSLSLTQSIIKKAFIKQTLQCHPDLHPTDPHANDKFRTLSDALRVALMAIRRQSPAHGKSFKRKTHPNESTGSNNIDINEKDERNEDVNENSDKWSDPQHTLEALRNAMLSYWLHHDIHNKNSANGHVESNKKHYHNQESHVNNGTKESRRNKSKKTHHKSASENINGTHLREEMQQKQHTVSENQVDNDNSNAENSFTSHSSNHTSSTSTEQENQHAKDEKEDVPYSFYAPSLEEITSVCRSESQAMYRIRTFCSELPSVLSGNISNPLFEAVAFYHAHHVQTTAECVMRFSRHLPVIVRRVVKNRKRHIRHSFNPRTRGINTGTRPLEQKIEDMTMKPLVLMGALIFDVPVEAQASPESCTTAALHSNQDLNETESNSKVNESSSGKGTESCDSISSTCGVNSIDEIHVTPSLRCIIEPSLSVGDVVERLSVWEAASFERLKVELAIVDANSLLTGMLGLAERNKLTVQPHLQHDNHAVTQVLVTLQKLACDMCLSFDELEDNKVHLTDTHDSELAALMIRHSFTSSRDNNNNSFADEAGSANESITQLGSSSSLLQQIEKLLLPTNLSETSITRLIAMCRKLASLASETIAYNITLNWNKDSDELLSVNNDKNDNNDDKYVKQEREEDDEYHKNEETNATHKVNAQDTKQMHDKKDSHDDNNNKGSTSNNCKHEEEYVVQRNPYSSTAEMIAFTVSVRLTCQLRDLLIRLCKAFHCVIAQTHKARSLLAEVVELREKVIGEEFIARTAEITEGENQRHVNATGENANANVEEQQSGQQDVQNLTIKAHDSYKNNVTSTVNNGESKYCYRPPIHCFPRLFNFDMDVEYRFWQYLYEIREHVAQHASQTGHFNVFYNCLPYAIIDDTTNTNSTSFSDRHNKTLQQSSHVMRVQPITPLHNLTREQCSSAHYVNYGHNSNSSNMNEFGSADSTHGTMYNRQLCGWVSDDGEGGSNVILMPSALESAELFHDWLDEIFEQGTLLRTAQRILRDAHIDYIKRAPELPLLHFLSFINLFVKATAVRALIEHHAQQHTRSGVGSSNSSQVGLTIVVDTYCDVCDGGLLHIPWHVDPSILLVLLGQFEQTRELDA